MPKYRKTVCQDEGFSKGMWLFSPIDLRRKYYKCNHCQKQHLVKDGLVKGDKETITSIQETEFRLARRLRKALNLGD